MKFIIYQLFFKSAYFKMIVKRLKLGKGLFLEKINRIEPFRLHRWPGAGKLSSHPVIRACTDLAGYILSRKYTI